MITIIAAITRDRALGRGGDMIYHISEDLKRFKAVTMGHPIIMGRRTFESFPKGPLPGRRNLVITRKDNYHNDGIEICRSLSDAIDSAVGDAFVIGGGKVYSQAMPIADCLLITEIDAYTEDADTFFPEIDSSFWHLNHVGEWNTDARSGVRFRYCEYRKKPLADEESSHTR